MKEVESNPLALRSSASAERRRVPAGRIVFIEKENLR